MTPGERQHVEALIRAERLHNRCIAGAIAPEIAVVVALLWIDPRRWVAIGCALGVYHVAVSIWLFLRWQRVVYAHDFGRFPKLRGQE